MTEFLSPDEARAILEAADRRFAKLRAEHPAAAHAFPPVSDEKFRYVMEKALLGELRKPLAAAAPNWLASDTRLARCTSAVIHAEFALTER
jgi:hypothetical protein